ncbi:FAD-dependent pyridine nucleotide-disulfide oxidoreductase [Pseudodesulfovibrio mercurii]|uniref:Ion-translocating oxidoreductase complex subunit B n=1 Tax=Pseudodesulfovibrio mercurii TaxID=641491 RepID=F0JDV6_9BACT|nr:FAD-dependent oxidoreductase [Pseudodesulfovibrio mercurii]EGB13396.1 FAD-dependent pyridine nucleotide-disulfide oxidoreductase [Pseudodesulfovibrio mercurii]
MVASSILVLFLLGLTAAAILAVASRILYVKEDPRVARVEACLPGANCGGCGYPGCSAAAAAVVSGDAPPEVCVVANLETSARIAGIMGAEVQFKEPKVATNICSGGSRANLLFDYKGVEDCRAEALLYGGEKSCGIGCIGLGTCVKVCSFNAIRLSDAGLPVVDWNACRSCGKCAEACPTGAIRISSVTSVLLHLNQTDDCLAPCMQKCPAQINVRRYVQQLKQGDMRGALLTIKEHNPLPLIVGRVCPAPCENICRRKIVDEGVAIHTLQRYVADWEMHSGTRVVLHCNPPSGHKVAIIGGGPAGLSCAYFLRRVGHEPVIFEKRQHIGGMMRGVIPEYRLPKKVVDWEVQTILNLGVETRTGVAFGRDVTLADLEKEGFEAVFIATGAWKVPPLGIENDNAEGVLDAISFLYGVGREYTDLRGKTVVVVGGSNTAMDVVRSAIRLGATAIALVPSIQRKMSANKEEIQRAVEIGADLRYMTAPIGLVAEDGAVCGVTYCDLAYDDPEKAKGGPNPVAGTKSFVAADMVIAATDRLVDDSLLRDADGKPLFKIDKKTGGISANPTTLQTDIPNVFVGGEVHTGRNILIQAVSDGRRAARSIHFYVTQGTVPEPDNQQVQVIPESILKDMHVTYSIPRVQEPLVSVEERKHTFKEEVAGSITYETARKEASRCLRCGLTCYDADAGAEYTRDADVKVIAEAGRE